MDSETIRVGVNPHDMRFLRDRTGADTNQEVIDAAVQFYKAAVLGAMNKETVAMVKQNENGEWEIAKLELPKGQFAYAAGNADVPSLSKDTIDNEFRQFVERQRRESAEGNSQERKP